MRRSADWSQRKLWQRRTCWFIFSFRDPLLMCWWGGFTLHRSEELNFVTNWVSLFCSLVFVEIPTLLGNISKWMNESSSDRRRVVSQYNLRIMYPLLYRLLLSLLLFSLLLQLCQWHQRSEPQTGCLTCSRWNVVTRWSFTGRHRFKTQCRKSGITEELTEDEFSSNRSPGCSVVQVWGGAGLRCSRFVAVWLRDAAAGLKADLMTATV